MAEGVLQAYPLRPHLYGFCGRPGTEMNGFAVGLMNENGSEISRHKPKTLELLEKTDIDLIIALSSEAGHAAGSPTS